MDFINSRVARIKQELTTAAAAKEEEPNNAEDISREDLLHLSMKLSRQLKVANTARTKLENEAKANRGRAEALAKFLSVEVLEDPSSIDNIFVDDESKKIDDEMKGLEARLAFCWEKRKLEMTAAEKDTRKEDELRSALGRVVEARDVIAEKLRAAEAARLHDQTVHEEQLVYLKMKAESQRQVEESDKAMQMALNQAESRSEAAEKRLDILEKKLENAREQVSERDTSIGELRAQAVRLKDEMNQTEQRQATKSRELLHFRDKLESTARNKKRLELKLIQEEREHAISSALYIAALASETATKAHALAQVHFFKAGREALAMALDDEKKAFAADAARRSALARQIVVDKEAEIAKLIDRCAELEADAASGGHAHRRIVELAHTQAHREAANNAEIRDLRLTTIKLQRALKKRDADLNLLSKRLSIVSTQLEKTSSNHTPSLRHTNSNPALHKNLDMEYLKNVILQYLTLPSGSSERASLVPVLATVLHFSDADIRTLKKAQQAASSSSSTLVTDFFSGLRAVSPPPPLSNTRAPRPRISPPTELQQHRSSRPSDSRQQPTTTLSSFSSSHLNDQPPPPAAAVAS